MQQSWGSGAVRALLRKWSALLPAPDAPDAPDAPGPIAFLSELTLEVF